MESLINKIYPLRHDKKADDDVNMTVYGKPEKLSVAEAFHEVLFSKNSRFTQDPYVQMFRDRVPLRKISKKTFMKFVRWLYREFSDSAAHKMAQFSPPLPKWDDFKGIQDMLSCVQIDADIPAVICVQIILEPFGLPPEDDDSSDDEDSSLTMKSSETHTPPQ